MALTSNDETDLLLPLLHAGQETVRFETFLKRLIRRSRADRVGIFFRPYPNISGELLEVGWPETQLAPSEWMAGRLPLGLDPMQLQSLRNGRVYALEELLDISPGARHVFFRKTAQPGLRDARIIRLSLDIAGDAWLYLARDEDCAGADSALLTSLAPYLSPVLDQITEMDRARHSALMTSHALTISRHLWVALDRQGRVMEIAPQMDRHWSEFNLPQPHLGERLLGLSPLATRSLNGALEELDNADEPQAIPVVLQDKPRIEVLVAPVPHRKTAQPGLAVAMVLFAMPLADPRQAASRLARAFKLPAREAELAVALATGQSIAQAAQAMGLTLETARNYSKRLFAKMGVTGQPGLVRQVYESSALLG